MDYWTLVFEIFAAAIVIMVISIPVILTLFTVGVVKKTAHVALRINPRRK